MSDCLFCKIANGDIPAAFVYESDEVIAFNDIDPKAPVHILIIPRKHFATTLDMADEASGLYGAMFVAAAAIARKTGIDKSGFRLMLNTNADGGQEVFHVHMHLLGGRPLGPLLTK